MAMAIPMVLTGGGRDLLRPGFWLITGAAGAAIGVIAAPIMSWLLLRDVPLGRAILHTAIGTVFGGILGLVLASPFIGAVAGFSAAALRLSISARQRSLRAAPAPSAIAGPPIG